MTDGVQAHARALKYQLSKDAPVNNVDPVLAVRDGTCQLFGDVPPH